MVSAVGATTLILDISQMALISKKPFKYVKDKTLRVSLFGV